MNSINIFSIFIYINQSLINNNNKKKIIHKNNDFNFDLKKYQSQNHYHFSLKPTNFL